MNKLFFTIQIIFLIGLIQKTNAQLKKDIPSSSIEVKQWVEHHFAKGKIPPFSFFFSGKSSDSFIKNWQYRAEKLKPKVPNAEETLYTYTDKSSGLVVKCTVTCFTDFPSVEWVLKFSNTSGSNTPILEKAAVIDYSFNAGTKGNFVLHHARGSNAERTDFQPVDENFESDKSIYMTPSGGRSSDK